MRISTAQYFESSAAKYQNNFSSIVKTQEQISSGVRIQTAADDPVGAAKLLLLQQQKDMLGQFSGNMSSLKNSLSNEESVLDSVNTSLQRARELAIQAGNGGLSDADRKSIGSEIGQIEKQVMGLLNSKDSSGQYMFSGSKSSTPPYVRNNDGTYTYQGDETPLSLQVSDTLSIASNDTGKTILEGAPNSGRTQATLQPPSINDGTVSVSAGLLTSNSTYQKGFTAGQPYTVAFTSSTQYTVTDAAGTDVTSEIPGNGIFDSKKEGSSSISLRGVTFDISLNLKDNDPTPDATVNGHVFTLQTKPDSFNASRTPSNTSTAQVTGANVTNQAAYASTFPSSGAVIKFTNATDYAVYAQPLSANSKAIATGTMAGTSITEAGVTFDVTGTPNPGDQFVVGASSHKSQSALETLGQLRKALETPSDGDVVAQLKLKDSVNAAIGNLSNATDHVDNVRGSIGARMNAIDTQDSENTSLDMANTSTQSSIADTDVAKASIDLAFQQSLLQASQLAFVKIAQLSLFSKL